VEVWTRFMKAAHQGVPVASLPNAQPAGLFSNLMQTASQVSAPSAPPAQVSTAPAPAAQAPAPLAPIPSGPANRPAPTRASARPEAAAGLDGWLVDRLFGR
jgi:penicillin-binding protein 1A